MAEQVTQVLGIVGISNKGEYSANAYYEKLNVVTYNGSSYSAKTDVHGVLPTNTDYWQLLASKGDTGDKGETGDTGQAGYTPVKGTDYYTASDIAELESSLSTDVTSEVSEQLSDLASATPIAVSDPSDMTDTSRIYVLTTDGHWYWYNSSTWTDGGVYQATGISESDPVISNKLDKSIFNNYLIYEDETMRDSVNMYNKDTSTNNKRLRSSGASMGNTYTAEGYWVSDYIPVSGGDTLFPSVNETGITLNGYVAYDENKTAIEYHTYLSRLGTTISDVGVAYIRVECSSTITSYNGNLQIQKNGITPYEPYGKWFDSTLIEPNEVVIAESGGDYTSLRTAFETEGENTIYKILEGTYKVDDDFTDTEISNASYSSSGTGFVGLRVPNNSKLIGIGDKRKIIIKTDISTTYSHSARYSIATLNLFGNCEIENLTVLAINTRTPIHDDFQASANSTHKITNCILRNETQIRDVSHGYGLGLRSGTTVLIEDTDIFPTMICHSNTSFSTEAFLKMKNVNIASNLNLSDYDSTKNVYVTLDNVNYGVLYYTKSNSENNNYMNINDLSNNEIPMLLKYDNPNINGYNIKENVANSNILKNQLVTYYTNSSGILQIRPANQSYNNMVGIALKSGNAGDVVKFYRFNKYINTKICGIESFNLNDEIVFDSNGKLSVGTENTIGRIISIFNDIGIIKLY